MLTENQLRDVMWWQEAASLAEKRRSVTGRRFYYSCVETGNQKLTRGLFLLTGNQHRAGINRRAWQKAARLLPVDVFFIIRVVFMQRE